MFDDLIEREQRLVEFTKPANKIGKLFKLSKSNKSGSGGVNTAAPRLKSVIRRLPPDLPEAIFWKSVEPWVIRESTPTINNVADKELDENMAEAGSSQIEKHPKAERVIWSCFKAGKVRRSGKDKDDVHSRAYISFKTLEGLMAFSKGYDGWSFRDKNGNTSQAVVEFAPYQKIPLTPAKLDTRRQGGIEEDPDYVNFLAVLSAPEPAKSDDITTTKKELPKTTPLLDHLRAQKVIELAARKGTIGFINSKVVSLSRNGRQSSSKSSQKSTSSGGIASSSGKGTVENGEAKRSRRKGKETNNGTAGSSTTGAGLNGTRASGSVKEKSGRSASGKGRSRNGGGSGAISQPIRPSVPPLSAFPLLNSTPSTVTAPFVQINPSLPFPPIPQQSKRSAQISQVQSRIQQQQQQSIHPPSQRTPIAIPFQNSVPQIQIQQRQTQQQRQPPQVSLLARPPQNPAQSSSSSQSQPRLNPPPLSNQLIPPTVSQSIQAPGGSSGNGGRGGGGGGGGGGAGGGGAGGGGGARGGGRRGQQQPKPDGAEAGQRRALGAALGAALGNAPGANNGGGRKRRGPTTGVQEGTNTGTGGEAGSTRGGRNNAGGGRGGRGKGGDTVAAAGDGRKVVQSPAAV